MTDSTTARGFLEVLLLLWDTEIGFQGDPPEDEWGALDAERFRNQLRARIPHISQDQINVVRHFASVLLEEIPTVVLDDEFTHEEWVEKRAELREWAVTALKERQYKIVESGMSGYGNVRLRVPMGKSRGTKRYYVPNAYADLPREVKKPIWIECHCGLTQMRKEDAKKFNLLADCCLTLLLEGGTIPHLRLSDPRLDGWFRP